MNNSGHRLTFLNRELGAINSPDGYSVIRKGKEITLKMNNNLPSNANMQSRAYVLCVISEFPAAS